MNLRGFDRWILAASIAYGSLLLTVWVALHWMADYRWWATVLLFLPRWIWAVPIFPLALVMALRRRLLWGLSFGLLMVGVFCVLNVCIPWRRLIQPEVLGKPLCVLTVNCDSQALKVEELRRLVEELNPDIVALQDMRQQDFMAIFGNPKWHVHHESELALASRLPIRSTEPCSAPELGAISGAIRHYQLDRDGKILHFFNIHMATPRWGLRAVYHHLWDGAGLMRASSNARRLQSVVAHNCVANYRDVIVAGDFNTPPESPVLQDHWNGMQNAFSVAGWGTGNTFDTGWGGLRIDYVLSDDRWACQACWTGSSIGSAHCPLYAILDRVAMPAE